MICGNKPLTLKADQNESLGKNERAPTSLSTSFIAALSHVCHMYALVKRVEASLERRARGLEHCS